MLSFEQIEILQQGAKAEIHSLKNVMEIVLQIIKVAAKMHALVRKGKGKARQGKGQGKARELKKKDFFCLLFIFKKDSRVLVYQLLSCEFDTDRQSLLQTRLLY